MSDRTKRKLKIAGIVVGSCVGVCILGLAWVGLGNIFIEQYHGPNDDWLHYVYQSARYGWSLKTGDGWAA